MTTAGKKSFQHKHTSLVLILAVLACCLCSCRSVPVTGR